MYKGIAQPIELQFGNTISAVAQWINQNSTCILIIEAVLSTFHNESGNPDIRGDFGQGRAGTEPIIDFIEGVPSVRVFHE
jgi:hypothetical protein